MLSPRQRVLAAILAVIGVLAWWQQQRGAPSGPEAPAGERRPDYTVDNFTNTTMDASGSPKERLTAVELRHYPDDNTKELERPRLTLFEETGPPWFVRSDTAWVSSDDHWIKLQGDVFIDREAGAETRPVRILTRELTVNRPEEFAQTNEHVRIMSESDWTTSDRGGRIWFGEEERAELYGRVRGEMRIE